MALLLNRTDVVSVLEMADCIDVLEKAFIEHAEGTADLPLRIPIKPPEGLALYMPAYLREMNALACKVVTVYKDNPTKHDLPTTIGTVLLQDAATGQVISIMDGGYLTAVRTGAVSGLATRFLARETPGQVAAIYGAGGMAQMQLWAVHEARKVAKALVYDVAPEKAHEFKEAMEAKLGFEVEVAKDGAALLEADIICTATSSSMPIFDGADVRPGTHLNGIGSHSPEAREFDSAVIQRSLVIADAREACLKEAGDIMLPIAAGEITADHIHAELGEVVAGKATGRTGDDQITLFKSNGLAIQDAATAKLVYDRARERGVGTDFEL